MKKTNHRLLGGILVLLLALGVTGCACKHTQAGPWTSDETHHWRECAGSDCAEVLDKAEHSWDSGKTTLEATAETAGVLTYTCTVCAKTRDEAVPMQGQITFAAGYSPFKFFDGKAVSAPTAGDYTANGTGEVTVEWYQGDTLLPEAPSEAGSYRLVLSMAASETLSAAQTSMNFSIFSTEGANVYDCDDGSVLYTFSNAKAGEYTTLCENYAAGGYEIYSETNMNGNLFTTFVKGAALAHVYYYPTKNELNLVVSDTAADTLPAKTPAVTDGTVPCTVAQIHQDAKNGMSYAIQLKDGSYIIYDGGYKNQAGKLAKFLKDNYTGEGKPIIRAWVLTHAHTDHYEVFAEFTKKQTESFIVENIIVSPLNEQKFTLNDPADNDPYLSDQFYKDAANFKGANVIFAHTGMEFTFCNLKMEILLTPEDLYKTATSYGNFNNTSIVSRLYTEDYSVMFTGDIGREGCEAMMALYGDYLKSDACQASHHGAENAPLAFYDVVKAPLLFCPSSRGMYLDQRNLDVRKALEKAPYTKEILVGGCETFVREWGTTFAADAPLSFPFPEIILTTDKTTYKVGEPILCTASGIGTDWLAVSRAGASTYQMWWYLQPVSGYKNVTSGVQFDMTTTPAEYKGGRTLTPGEYVISIIENNAGFATGSRLAEIKITVVSE